MSTLTNQISVNTQPVKVVIIEDNLAVSQWLTEKINGIENLKLAGSMSTYDGAFELIKKAKPEVIILDLKLPDGSGLDILKSIRKANLNTIVMILTLSNQARNACFKLGADYFFDKSKDTDKLVEKLKNLDVKK